MKVNIKIGLCATVFILFIGYNVYSSQKEGAISEMALANIEALASGEELGCGGNSTFIKDNTLKSTLCPPLWLGGSHLKCKSETNVCCDPSKQSDCKGGIF